jgi:hypothetical protein
MVGEIGERVVLVVMDSRCTRSSLFVCQFRQFCPLTKAMREM